MGEARDRLKRLKRLQDVQKQRHRLEEWKLARLRQEENGLRKAQEEVLDALNADHPLHGLFLAGLGARVGSLGRAIAGKQRAGARQAVATLEQGRRQEVAEKFVRRARRDADEEDRRTDFLDYLDRHLAQTGEEALPAGTARACGDVDAGIAQPHKPGVSAGF
jgi:hypothetical protein